MAADNTNIFISVVVLVEPPETFADAMLMRRRRTPKTAPSGSSSLTLKHIARVTLLADIAFGVNGMELSGLADRAGFVDEFNEAVPAKPQPTQYSCDPKAIQALQRLVEALPVKLGDVTSALPDLCKAAVGLITNFKK